MKNKKEAQNAAEISADDNAQPQQRETDDGLATVEQNNAADETPRRNRKRAKQINRSTTRKPIERNKRKR